MRNMTCIRFNLVIIFLILSASVISCHGARHRTRTHRSGGNLFADEDAGENYRYRRSPFSADEADGDADEYDPDEIINISTNKEGISEGRRTRIDPKSSWLTFSNRLERRNEEHRKKKRKRKSSNKLLGPPGPVGPPGPPGPPGTSVSKEEILKAVEDLIKEAAEKRAKEMVAEMRDLLCNWTLPLQQDMPGGQVPWGVVHGPRVYAGFSLRLKTNTRVNRKTMMELHAFQQPFGEGSFQRGDVFNAREGRFHVPRDGVYQFSASLHLQMRTKGKVKARLKDDEHIKVVICINSLCQTNTSIETLTGVLVNSTVFTSSVHGLLFLKEKQYTSVYIDNSSNYSFVVRQGSEFSGVFMGT
ncbi:adipolin-like [Dreissena polymorpha]|uniref:C1q domain-containing protein n=1 Tax=Dreissena polymorpha TaxID=45954 RepID=A0A9D4GJI8_DREPO|nr:adipolin-like [Dreissena polymorpha]KAH3818007.1 hypothetical protein DPMN_119592 [Dreissena polymorpha]